MTDTQQRRIDDWTNSFWPFHLEANESLLASGRVRMEGVANQWVEAGEAEATVTYERFRPRTSPVDPTNGLGGREVVPFVDGGSGGRWLVHRGGFNTVGRRRGPQQHLPRTDTFPLAARPLDVEALTSEDRTVVLTPTRILHDTVQPSVDALTSLDSGQEVVADGHVAMYGKDIALRLQLSDPEGLASQLEVWTWLERLHDVNNNGVMEADEYRMETVS